jgi:pre-mRNA cleavage complex 2 protein Pcf11
MHQHLDDHFAQNRKANQETGRGHSRAWFVSVEVRAPSSRRKQPTHVSAQDWIRGSSGNDKGKGRADPNSTSNATMPSLSELRAQFVVVPPGDEAKNISCPICKENMKSEFMEDDEEWVWRNAVLKDDKVRRLYVLWRMQ